MQSNATVNEVQSVLYSSSGTKSSSLSISLARTFLKQLAFAKGEAAVVEWPLLNQSLCTTQAITRPRLHVSIGDRSR